MTIRPPSTEFTVTTLNMLSGNNETRKWDSRVENTDML
jgi:hypothetical protein